LNTGLPRVVEIIAPGAIADAEYQAQKTKLLAN